MLYQPGQTLLNKYRIKALAGRGAFAEVYHAIHMGLMVPRALKVLRKDIPGLGRVEFQDYLGRFQLEAQLGAALDHPNVIRVYDFEQDGDLLVLVIQYAPGGSLADLLQASRTVAVEKSIMIATHVASGLSAIHAHDVVHRDLKPSNILFDAQGVAKVSDLGLAQIAGSGSSRSTFGFTPHPGTPAYMSPEQEREGRYLSPASDIYALGLIWFEMLTGRPYKNLRPGTPIRALCPDIPESLETIISKALESDATKRYWDGAEIAEAIAAEIARHWTPAQQEPIGGERLISQITRTTDPDANTEGTKETDRSKTEQNAHTAAVDEVDLIAASLPSVPPDVVKQGSASLILKPRLRRLLDPIKQVTIRELLTDQQSERLVEYLTAFGGGRFLLMGYGSFGGTTLCKEIVNSAKHELPSRQQGTGFISAYFGLEEFSQDRVAYRTIIQDVDQGVLAQQLEIRATDAEAQLSPITRVLDFLDGLLVGNRAIMEDAVKYGLSQSAQPSRIVVCVDKVPTAHLLTVFTNHALFTRPPVAFLIVIERESYDRWSDKEQSEIERRFQVWHVPSLWEREHHVVDQIMNALFSTYGLQSAEAEQLSKAFSQHIAFVGRGAIGATMSELQKLKYWRLDKQTRQPFIAFDALDRELISHNATVQAILDRNWERFLGTSFPGRERTDRAKRGIYALMDWIIDSATFTLEEILDAANNTPITISKHGRLSKEVVARLLDILVENNYLHRVNEEYDIAWGRDKGQYDQLIPKAIGSGHAFTIGARTEALQKRLADLGEEYQAANSQLSANLNEVERKRLRRQMTGIEQEMSITEIELSKLRGRDELKRDVEQEKGDV